MNAGQLTKAAQIVPGKHFSEELCIHSFCVDDERSANIAAQVRSYQDFLDQVHQAWPVPAAIR